MSQQTHGSRVQLVSRGASGAPDLNRLAGSRRLDNPDDFVRIEIGAVGGLSNADFGALSDLRVSETGFSEDKPTSRSDARRGSSFDIISGAVDTLDIAEVGTRASEAKYQDENEKPTAVSNFASLEHVEDSATTIYDPRTRIRIPVTGVSGNSDSIFGSIDIKVPSQTNPFDEPIESRALASPPLRTMASLSQENTEVLYRKEPRSVIWIVIAILSIGVAASVATFVFFRKSPNGNDSRNGTPGSVGEHLERRKDRSNSDEKRSQSSRVEPGKAISKVASKHAIGIVADKYDEGVRVYKEGDFLRAGEVFESVYRMNPKPETLMAAARSYRQAGKLQKAATLAAQVLEQDGSNMRMNPKVVAAAESIVNELGGTNVFVRAECKECTLEVDGTEQKYLSFYLKPDKEYIITARSDTKVINRTIKGTAGDTVVLYYDDLQ